jgi:GDP-L-fucose synthase
VAVEATWPDSKAFWRDKRVVVMGGAGFLGSFVVEKLHKRGAAEVFMPRSKEYDLCRLDAIRRMLTNARPSERIGLTRRSFSTIT